MRFSSLCLCFFSARVRSAREKRHLAKISSSSEGVKRCVLITSNAVFARVCRAEDDRLRPARNASLYNSITMCFVEFLHLFFLFAHHHFDSRKTLSLLSFVKPGWSTTGRVPVRALRATHPIHRPIWACLIRRLLRRSRVRFLPNRTREQTPTKSVGRKAQRASDISSIFTSRGR